MRRGAPLKHRRASAARATVELDRGVCPHPHKMAFPSKADAKRKLRSATTPDRDAFHAYLCPCGLWHLGHKPKKAA